MKYLWVSRLFAAALIFGGAGGTAISILSACQLSSRNGMDFFSAVALVALYFFTVVIGIALWKNKYYGTIWAAILFALQVPVFSSPTFSYEWFTGVTIKFVVSKGAGGWSIELGGADNFHLQSDALGMAYGGNVFAVAAVVCLLIALAGNSFLNLPNSSGHA